MDENDLFFLDDINGNPRFYVDEECTQPYTGYTKDYFQGVLCREAEVVDGYYDGICKEYYQLSDKLEMISHMKYSLQTGLSIEFYESGKVRAVALVIQNYDIDYIIYNEDGTIDAKEFWTNERKIPFSTEEDMKQIKELRAKYDLLKIHEEIVRDGEKFNYKKYFGL